jgi:hypothetical protein
MASSRFLALAFIASILVCGSIVLSSHPISDIKLMDRGSDIESTSSSVRNPYTDPNIYRVYIDFSDERAAWSSDQYLNYIIGHNGSSEWSLTHLREFHIEGVHSLGNISLVEQAFGKFENLTTVVWDYEVAISLPIIRLLEENSPLCKLYYTLPFYKMGDQVDEALFDSPNLYTLKANIWYGYWDNSYPMVFILNALFRNHNIRELQIGMFWNSCEIYHDLWSFDFASYPNARFPPLEVLELNGYHLDAGADGDGDWYFVTPDRIKLNSDNNTNSHSISRRVEKDERTNLDAWMQVMDWSQLHTLDLSRPSDASLARLQGDALPSLKNLTLDMRRSNIYRREKIPDFVTHTAQSLESLSLKDVSPLDGNEILRSFILEPSRLQELKSFSFGAGGENICALSEAHIRQFLKTAPRIERVDLNIPRQANISMFSEPFRSLLSSPTLQHVTLRFPSPDNPYGQWPLRQELDTQYQWWAIDNEQIEKPDPLINRESVRHLFKEMRREKEGADLETVEFVIGNWDDRYWTSMAGGNGRPRVAYWKCFLDGGKEVCYGGQQRMWQ